MPDRTPPDHASGPQQTPPPLTVAAFLVGLQGLALLSLGAVEVVSIVGERVEIGVSTAVFFLLCGVGLIACGFGLHRCRGWARGPALLAQLIALGLAWNLRDIPMVALVLVISAVVTLAGLLNAASLSALLGERAAED